MRVWIVSVLLSALAASPALAQGSKPAHPAQPQKAAESKPGESKPAPVIKSALTGVTFPVAPIPLTDDGTYASYMTGAAERIGRTCERGEGWGWDFKGLSRDQAQQRLDETFQSTMKAFEEAGYKIAGADQAIVPGTPMTGFTADSAANKLLLVWSTMDDSTLMLVCKGKVGGGKPTPAKPAPAKPAR